MHKDPGEVATPILNIIGTKVALGPLRRDLLLVYARWMNDFEVTRTLAVGWRPLTNEQEEDWFESASRATDQMTFTVYERETLRPIGNSGLTMIDLHHRTAEFGIVIGEKDAWRRGYGTEATSLVLDYGFTGLGLHNIMLRVYATNEGGIRAYQRAGFKIIGRRRESRLWGTERIDTVFMDCLAEDRGKSVLEKLL